MKFLVVMLLLMMLNVAFGHDRHDPKHRYDPKHGHDPTKKQKEAGTDTARKELHQHATDSIRQEAGHKSSAHQENAADEAHTSDMSYQSADHPHDSNEFPSLHPLVVHFPIMFLLIAAVMQLFQFFVFKHELSWVVVILLVLGFIGAYVSGRYVHPHTHGLSQRAAQILKEHDLYADWTVWLSGLGSLLKIGSHFVLKRKVWAEMIVAIVLLGAAYAVSMAGHHGAQLVHIEGVGPQGKYLEKHAH